MGALSSTRENKEAKDSNLCLSVCVCVFVSYSERRKTAEEKGKMKQQQQDKTRRERMSPIKEETIEMLFSLKDLCIKKRNIITIITYPERLDQRIDGTGGRKYASCPNDVSPLLLYAFVCLFDCFSWFVVDTVSRCNAIAPLFLSGFPLTKRKTMAAPISSSSLAPYEDVPDGDALLFLDDFTPHDHDPLTDDATTGEQIFPSPASGADSHRPHTAGPSSPPSLPTTMTTRGDEAGTVPQPKHYRRSGGCERPPRSRTSLPEGALRQEGWSGGEDDDDGEAALLGVLEQHRQMTQSRQHRPRSPPGGPPYRSSRRRLEVEIEEEEEEDDDEVCEYPPPLSAADLRQFLPHFFPPPPPPTASPHDADTVEEDDGATRARGLLRPSIRHVLAHARVVRRQPDPSSSPGTLPATFDLSHLRQVLRTAEFAAYRPSQARRTAAEEAWQKQRGGAAACSSAASLLPPHDLMIRLVPPAGTCLSSSSSSVSCVPALRLSATGSLSIHGTRTPAEAYAAAHDGHPEGEPRGTYALKDFRVSSLHAVLDLRCFMRLDEVVHSPVFDAAPTTTATASEGRPAVPVWEEEEEDDPWVLPSPRGDDEDDEEEGWGETDLYGEEQERVEEAVAPDALRTCHPAAAAATPTPLQRCRLPGVRYCLMEHPPGYTTCTILLIGYGLRRKKVPLQPPPPEQLVEGSERPAIDVDDVSASCPCPGWRVLCRVSVVGLVTLWGARGEAELQHALHALLPLLAPHMVLPSPQPPHAPSPSR
eukprot:gene12359-8486_t